ncbi:MAG: nuclear transport factor 2 family protein [Calditrichaeota bacterium]|nr:nuclear transport factor 2 family protein [Calditrichota bacterium]
MRTIVLILLTVACLFFEGCEKKLDPVQFVRHYLELHRAHDIDGLLALHTDDTEFVLSKEQRLRGKKALRDLLEWDAVLESELTMRGISMRGDTIRIDTVIERNRLFKALGTEQVIYKPGTRFVLRNGLIAGTYPAGMSEESVKDGKKEFRRLIRWLSVNRPDTLARLLPGGKLRQDGASARLWLKVLEEWKQVEP